MAVCLSFGVEAGGGWGCSDICHNNSHRYQFPFVFTLKFWENVFWAYGAHPHPSARHTNIPTCNTYTCSHIIILYTVQQYGAAIERCWHRRISLKIGIYTTHHLVTVNMCAKPTLSASALVWRAVEIASEWCWQSEWERAEVMETERGTKIWRVAPDSYGKWLWRLTAAVASTKVVWVRKAVIWMQHDSLSAEWI